MTRRLRPGVLAGAALFFAAAAVLFTWPLAARMRSGLPDMWDDKLNAWIFHWDFHQVFRDPLHLFDTNIFHPAKTTLAFSENLFGAAIFGFPLYAAGASTLFTANVLMLLGMALSGLAAWALAREITGDAAASLVAGVVYAFAPWRIAQLPHVQFQWGAFLALLLLFLLRSFEEGRRRDAVLFGVFFAWNALTNVHYALFSGLVVALVAVYAALTLEPKVFLRRAAGVALAGAAACVVALPFYLPYRKAAREYGMVRYEPEIEFFSGRPIDFLTAGDQNKLYARLTQKWGKGEGDFFPGVGAVALAIVGWRLLRRETEPPATAERVSRRRRIAARVLDVLILAGVAAAVAAWALHTGTLGPIKVRDRGRVVAIAAGLAVVRLALAFPARSRFASLSDFTRRARAGSRALLFSWIAGLGVLTALGMHTPFYRLLVQSFGSVFRAVRVPGRGITLFHLALGVLAAWGLSLATRRLTPARRWLAVAAALAVVGFEYRAFPIRIFETPEAPAAAYRWVASLRLPERAAIVEWPLGFEIDSEHVFRSTAHWKPLVNGYSGFAPPAYDRLHARLEARPIADDIWGAMRSLDAAVLLFHPCEMGDEAIRRYGAALRRGLRSGAVLPIAEFPREYQGESLPDLAFRIAGSPAFAAPAVGGTPIASTADALALLDVIEERRTAPFGVLQRPDEGETVSAGFQAFGWALDDSGISRITMASDGLAPVECSRPGPFPGVDAIYPKYPETDRSFFACTVPRLPAGPRVLVVEVTGRDGGRTIWRRTVVAGP